MLLWVAPASVASSAQTDADMSDELRNSGGFLTLLIGVVWRWVSKEPAPFPRNVLPTPARLLLVSLAYLFARDWNHFLEIQERLLFNVTRSSTGLGAESQCHR